MTDKNKLSAKTLAKLWEAFINTKASHFRPRHGSHRRGN